MRIFCPDRIGTKKIIYGWKRGAKSTDLIKDLLAAEPDLDWTFLSPSHILFPGERTAEFRLGPGQMLVGPDGESRISVEDYAVAMIDELENPHHTGRRFTVGY
jgi:putative NADH-flavin reductase